MTLGNPPSYASWGCDTTVRPPAVFRDTQQPVSNDCTETGPALFWPGPGLHDIFLQPCYDSFPARVCGPFELWFNTPAAITASCSNSCGPCHPRPAQSAASHRSQHPELALASTARFASRYAESVPAGAAGSRPASHYTKADMHANMFVAFQRRTSGAARSCASG